MGKVLSICNKISQNPKSLKVALKKVALKRLKVAFSYPLYQTNKYHQLFYIVLQVCSR